MSTTIQQVMERVRTVMNDDDLSKPVTDPLVMLQLASNAYLKVAAVLGTQPAKTAVAVAGVSEVSLGAIQPTGIGELLYTDAAVTDWAMPKMDYESVLRLRGGRSTLAQMRPRVYAARPISGGTVSLYFDTRCPDDATAQLWKSSPAVRFSGPTDVVYLSETGILALESMLTILCVSRLPKDKVEKLGLGDTLISLLQSEVDTILTADKSDRASIELADRVVQTED